MTKYVVCLALALMPILCECYLDVMGVSKERTSEPEEDKIEKVRSWLHNTTVNPLPKYCSGADEDAIPDKDLLIRHVPCHEKGAIKR